jgi:predicted peptidase
MTFKTRISHRVELDYLLHVPATYDQGGKDQRWPLILFLHGAGERGDDVEIVAKHGPPKLVAAGKDLPAIVVSPQCPANQWWTDHLEALTALLDQTARRYRVDPDRVYVTGLSMGGYGTWALVARYSERFAAALPICGGGNRSGLARAMDLPIWAFHGEADPMVPLDETTRLVDAMRNRSAKHVKLTTYPGVLHDSWTQTYDDPAVWEWLFAQRRGQ